MLLGGIIPVIPVGLSSAKICNAWMIELICLSHNIKEFTLKMVTIVTVAMKV